MSGRVSPAGDEIATSSYAHPRGASRGGERRTAIVVGITLVVMGVEIAAGLAFGSMALLADGWHMGTHAAALGITLFAYWYARRHADDPAYSFGTGKVGVLGGFASAVGLAIVALAMAAESVHRLFEPRVIFFDEAIAVAALGLVVNLGCAYLLHQGGSHGHDHGHAHDRDHAHAHGAGHGVDHNLKAAYFHVLADAVTSVLAIGALLVGKLVGLTWLDPLIGVVGALVIARWSVGLIRETAAVLLDRNPHDGLDDEIRARIEADGPHRVIDLHVWRLGSDHVAAEVVVESAEDRSPEHFKRLLAAEPRLEHVVVEVNRSR